MHCTQASRVELLQIAVGIERGHAAGAGRGDGLAVDVIGDIAGGEHARQAGRGGIALAAAVDAPGSRRASRADRETVDVLGVWPMAMKMPVTVMSRVAVDFAVERSARP